MDLIVMIITAYFLGKKVENKGYSSYRWRIRHVSACLFSSILTSLISLSIQDSLEVAAASGLVAMIGVVIYRWQKIENMEDAPKQ